MTAKEWAENAADLVLNTERPREAIAAALLALYWQREEERARQDEQREVEAQREELRREP